MCSLSSEDRRAFGVMGMGEICSVLKWLRGDGNLQSKWLLDRSVSAWRTGQLPHLHLQPSGVSLGKHIFFLKVLLKIINHGGVIMAAVLGRFCAFLAFLSSHEFFCRACWACTQHKETVWCSVSLKRNKYPGKQQHKHSEQKENSDIISQLNESHSIREWTT